MLKATRSTDRSDLLRGAAITGGRALLSFGLALVLSMVGLAIAWGLFVFSSSSDRTVFMVMNTVGAAIGASFGANIAWIKLDRQQRLALVLALLLCVAGAAIGGLLGYQYAANREVECCAEPQTTPFMFTAFGAAIGSNVVIYLGIAVSSAARMFRLRKGVA